MTVPKSASGRKRKKLDAKRIYLAFPPDWDTMTKAEQMKAAELMAEAMQAALLPRMKKRRQSVTPKS